MAAKESSPAAASLTSRLAARLGCSEAFLVQVMEEVQQTLPPSPNPLYLPLVAKRLGIPHAVLSEAIRHESESILGPRT